jgi:hypothetical protein
MMIDSPAAPPAGGQGPCRCLAEFEVEEGASTGSLATDSALSGRRGRHRAADPLQADLRVVLMFFLS